MILKIRGTDAIFTPKINQVGWANYKLETPTRNQALTYKKIPDSRMSMYQKMVHKGMLVFTTENILEHVDR